MRQTKNQRWRWLVSTATATLLLAGAGVALTGGAAAGATTAGCGSAPTLSSGTHTISSGGQNRTFILGLPNNYDQNRPHRLIFGFHWRGGTATDVANGGFVRPYYGLRELAEDSAIFVAPQGLNNGWANVGGRDVAFTDDMLELIESDLCVDTTQRFSLGWSWGGGMSYALACARSEVFRAVAIYSGGVISGCTGGNSPIAYMQVHGISDQVLSISGGRAMRDRFVANNGCDAANPPEPSQGSGTHTSFHYSGCSAGHPTAWYAFDGGHTPVPTDRNGSQWLPGETWRFFEQFESTPPTSAPPTSAPPTSAPPTSAPPTSAPPTGGCSATYQTINSWPGGFQGEVTVRAGTSGVNGWAVSWTLADGQQITQAWGGELSVSGSSVTVANASWNGSLNANGETTFGFLGNGSPSTPTLTCAAA